MGAGPALAGFGHRRFVEERAHSLERGRAEGGRQENNFRAEPLFPNKVLKSREKCQPPAPPKPLAPALEQPVPRQKFGPFWSLSSGGKRLEKCKAIFHVPIP